MEDIKKIIHHLELLKMHNVAPNIMDEAIQTIKVLIGTKSHKGIPDLFILDNSEYCWQECCATEHCGKCKRLCNGDTDFFDNMFYENDNMCEWEKGSSGYVGYPAYYSKCCKTDSKGLEMQSHIIKEWEYCPYCGKKIKVVE